MVALKTHSAPRKKPTVAPPSGPRSYRFSVDDFHRMAETGILREESRVELIEGEIILLPPIDIGHAQGTHRSERRIERLLGEKHEVRCQQPVRLSSQSEPIPDVSIVKPKNYTSHPEPADTFLIMEVANSSLQEDLGRKKLIYAAAAIPEYWVLDINARELHVFSRPRKGDYATHRTFTRNETAQSATLKQLAVLVQDLLP